MSSDFAGIEADRERLNISRARLCRAADVSDSTYSRLLNGGTSAPQIRTLSRLRKALDRISSQRSAAGVDPAPGPGRVY